ncbi:secretion system protein E [Candidatus Saccharibacteria bacterium RIFCSPHIGHO2_12_FULL_47_16b]|nr:MAG: secretion system protein E [Candidatus Saccharibacteria bacterium RIFCSPHIGHO2_12_FULL_47_16b]OGL38776.1 MAG: secretion system protein E [Candidatus Saccharibacteria bacterium RIFCSPLOWO2_02_FULL_46_7]
MRINDAMVVELLKANRKIKEDQIKGLLDQQKTDKRPLQDLVLTSNLISEKDFVQAYAARVEVPFVEVIPKNIRKEVLRLIPEHIARQYNAVLFDVTEDGTKLLAMEDPDDVQAINFLQKQLGTNIKVYIATRSNILAALDQYRTNLSSELTEVIASQSSAVPGVAEAEEEVTEEDVAEDSPVAQTVNLIIEDAIKQNASDVHIEPREDHVSVRYRIDGQLRETNRLPKKVVLALVSRIKILSNLKIDEHRAPQDGRFKINVGSGQYALRVSTLPIVEGEKVVMRILDESSKPATLEDLGFWGSTLDRLEHALTRPHGMILFTGPTGSGKSTSLFSILSRLNQPSVNISTVEDPVEYKIPGVNQVQVNPIAGMTFANGLRALLRQDPNIIMVGEIRDGETANLAVQAALTGHLVFSTLHTNNAATCLPRLLDMGIEPFLIASTVRAVVGQRLVRKLVPDSIESYVPDMNTQARIRDSFGIKNQQDMARINQLELQAMKSLSLQGAGTSDKSKTDDKAATTETTIERLWRIKASSGSASLRGRLGIYEVLSISSDLQKLVIGGYSADDIQDQAIKEGMVTMQTDGLIKSLRGLTTLEEVMRVTIER